MVANVRRSHVYERSGPSPMDAIPVSSPKGSAPADDVILRTVGVTKRYGQRLAVNQLNLDIHRGGVFGLLGPHGRRTADHPGAGVPDGATQWAGSRRHGRGARADKPAGARRHHGAAVEPSAA